MTSKHFMLAILIALAILLMPDPSRAQTNNPFPPKEGQMPKSKTTYKQECSGLTAKGKQCKRMVAITKEQYSKPTAQYCYQHQNQK